MILAWRLASGVVTADLRDSKCDADQNDVYRGVERRGWSRFRVAQQVLWQTVLQEGESFTTTTTTTTTKATRHLMPPCLCKEGVDVRFLGVLSRRVTRLTYLYSVNHILLLFSHHAASRAVASQ
ncbi:hypothetical protein E2C01_075846 [Portunus trituberculatus]|uniref:Uncharacterized protein n=1 Tax=Portunus trituberculatus TaxID=210409 RepID=A0A5B7IHE2_PORTR|nr:hypothetical protein [Portunus trituberculatus]